MISDKNYEMEVVLSSRMPQWVISDKSSKKLKSVINQWKKQIVKGDILDWGRNHKQLTLVDLLDPSNIIITKLYSEKILLVVNLYYN